MRLSKKVKKRVEPKAAERAKRPDGIWGLLRVELKEEKRVIDRDMKRGTELDTILGEETERPRHVKDVGERKKGARHMELDMKRIEDAVIAEATESLVHSYSRVGDNSLYDEIRTEAMKIIREAVDTQVKQILASSITAMTFPQTNSFRETTGPDLSLREYIDKIIRGYLDEKTDRDGRRDGYGDKMPRIHWLLKTELEKHIEASVKTASSEIKKVMSQCIADIVKARIDQVVSRLS